MLIRRTVAALAAMLALPAAATAALNPDLDSAVVYSANVENLPEQGWPEGCNGEWRNLVAYLDQPSVVQPDIFLVQQVDGIKELRKYVRYLSKQLPGEYAGTIAREKPRDQGVPAPCRERDKSFQTNAVIWRSNRFKPLSVPAPNRIDARKCRPSSLTVCYPSLVFARKRGRSGKCVTNGQSRTANTVLRLNDTRLTEDTSDDIPLTVASIHWPTGKVRNQSSARKGWNRCARANARRARTAVGAAGDAIQVFGGDANIRSTEPWYGYVGGTLGFTDPFGPCTDPACANANWTYAGKAGVRRIDFLFARPGAGGVSGAHTVSFEEARALAPADYSAHRAVSARIGY